METDKAVNVVLSSVKKSNLNFYIQESPFSLYINLRKTFIKNKEGNILYPPCSDTTTDDTIKQKEEVAKLEKENCNLRDTVGQLEAELNETRNALHKSNNKLENINKDVKNLQMENEILVNTNNELQVTIDTIESERNDSNNNMKSKNKEIAKLVSKNSNLEEKIKHLKSENTEQEEKIKLKDDEIISLEKKMKDLLDILYGCHDCGLCECECGDSIPGDYVSYLPTQCATTTEPSSPPPTALETPASPHPPQPSSTSPSTWTPPPTPPCSSCGGANFGPCPGDVCFGCLPPLQTKPEHTTSSPSRTPPGTPPLLRIDQRAAPKPD